VTKIIAFVAYKILIHQLIKWIVISIKKSIGTFRSVTREKLSMAKGKPQQTGMTAEINSIPTCAI
jgi:hypothetical protein